MNFQPLGDKILVKLDPFQDNTSEAGVIMPVTVKPATKSACVIAVGDGIDTLSGFRAFDKLKVGDKVMLPFIAGFEVQIGVEKFHIVSYREIHGVYGE